MHNHPHVPNHPSNQHEVGQQQQQPNNNNATTNDLAAASPSERDRSSTLLRNPARSSDNNERSSKTNGGAAGASQQYHEPPPLTTMEDIRRQQRRTGGSDNQTSFVTQFKSCVLKHYHEKRRDVVATVLEFGLPILFIIGSIILWTVFSRKSHPARQFLNYTDPGSMASSATSFNLVRATMCVNATANPGGVNSFPMCTFPLTSDGFCFPHDPFVPVDGLCTTDMTVVSALFATLLGNVAEMLVYPWSVDDVILTQWLFKYIAGDVDHTSSNNPIAALISSGKLYFAPVATETDGLVQHFNTTSDLFRYVYGGTYSVGTALSIVTSQTEEGKNWGIIVVNSLTASNFNVEIRLNHSSMPETSSKINRYYLGGLETDNILYVLSGFYTLEWIIGKYYTETIANVGATVNAPFVMPMGYAEYNEQQFLAFGGMIIPLLIVLGFLYPVAQLAKRIVLEKELRIREAMKIMGLRDAPFYCGWLSVYAFQHLVCASIITIILKTTYLTRANGGVLFFTFLFFELSTITMAGLISSIFSKARLAALVTPLIYFATAIPLFVIATASASTRSGLLILAPTAFANAIQLLFEHELGGGLGTKQIRDSQDEPPMITVLVMLAIDTIIYFILWLWADQVAPNDWGTTRFCCFCITDPILYVYRKIRGIESKKLPTTDELPDGRSIHGVFDEPVVDEKTTVQLLGLRKEFQRGDKTFTAVNNLYWQLREGEISVLLGHNGAGKTTTMNIMTGMLEADAGDCYIYGYSVRNELDRVRKEIGFCPQHNVLWPDLTCEEHLRFYGAIKGIEGPELDKAVVDSLEAVDLMDKREYKSSGLSGGQKRKLSVAIAFVGGSRLIFLDEPTAGMDVGARRHTWSLLQRMAGTHTILLSTHFMDEADLLGHSIGIMASGSMQCSGSSLFLKSRLGVGYNIVLGVDVHVDAARVGTELSRFVSDAELLSSGPGEITYRLPATAVSSFPHLLLMLETQGPSIGVRNFSISATTLEEIFLQVAHGVEEHQQRRISKTAIGDNNDLAGNNSSVSTPSQVHPHINDNTEMSAMTHTGVPIKKGASVWNVQRLEPDTWALTMTQMDAMLTKRFKNSLRDRRTQCLQVILPVACLLLAMLFTLIEIFATPSLTLNSAFYGETTLTDLQGCASLFDLSLPVPGTILREPSGLTNALNMSNYLMTSANFHGDYERYSAMACEDATLQTAVTAAAPVSVVFYNTSSFHELPIGVYNYFNNIYRKAAGPSSQAMLLTNNPMPKTPRETAFEDSIRSLLIGIVIMIPFTFIPSTFVAWVVKERECKARHLQNVSGLGFGVYWVSNFLFDTASFLITMFLAIIVFLIFGRDEYIGSDAIGATILLFLFYGLSGVAFSYLVSFLFDEHSSAQNIVMLANFIAGFLLVLVVFILNLVDSTKSAAEVLAYIFRLVPSYALGDGIINLALHQTRKAFGTSDTVWTMTVAGADILYMALEVPVALLLVFFIDHPGRRMKTQALLHNPDAKPEVIDDEEEDVARERAEVENSEANGRANDLVIVKNMRKEYSNGKVAVKNLSFGVHPGEVFGFLGTNGAGKTTTISILCQEFFPTAGHGYIAGHDIVNEAEAALRCIGYCPQFDALLDLLTVEEHLQMYAGVRGVVASERARVVSELAELCELTKYLPSVSCELSGGNKRKLSVALSLLGGPSVVFLDEPSAGMDPMARRGLWSAIETVADNCAVVLTTHHLEEVEALAHRVAIMVDGTLRCIGDKLHLKTKYGSGFELSLKLSSNQHCRPLEAFVQQQIPQAVLNESRGLRYTYALPQDSKLSAMFSLMEKQKEALGITDYSISQTSIEQVFLRISAEAEMKNSIEEARRANGDPTPTPTPAENNNHQQPEARSYNALPGPEVNPMRRLPPY